MSVEYKTTSRKFIQDVFHTSQRHIGLLFYLSIGLVYILCILQQIKDNYQSCFLEYRICLCLWFGTFSALVGYLENHFSPFRISDKAVACTIKIVDAFICQFCRQPWCDISRDKQDLMLAIIHSLHRCQCWVQCGLGYVFLNIAYKINTHHIEYSIISSVTGSVGRG